MAATYNVHSLGIELAKSVNDAAYSYMTLIEYQRFPLQCRMGGMETFNLVQIGSSGVWDYRSMDDEEPIALWLQDHAAPFSSALTTTYEVYCIGPNIMKSAGATDSTTSYTLTGFRINFREARARVKEWIADNRLTQYTQSLGGMSISPEQARLALLKDAAHTRGAFGV